MELSHFSHRPPLVTYDVIRFYVICQPFLSVNLRLIELCKISITTMQKDILILAQIDVKLKLLLINKSE